MDVFDLVPSLREVESDLKQIVHNLDRWEALPLHGLRALPSVASWEPKAAEQEEYDSQPIKRRSNDAIVQRIKEAIGRTIIKNDQLALTSLLTFHEPEKSLKDRQSDAAPHRGVTAEGFRKGTEKILLREFAEEMYRWEFAQAVSQSRSAGQVDLDTTPSAAAQ